MTLFEIRAKYWNLFHPNQDWFLREPFMAQEIPDGELTLPTGKVQGDARTSKASVEELAALYVTSPDAPIWRDYLWTSTYDSYGQQVFVGGTANGRGFEIHRHLTPNERWGIPIFG